jgi:hypothetical protein
MSGEKGEIEKEWVKNGQIRRTELLQADAPRMMGTEMPVEIRN